MGVKPSRLMGREQGSNYEGDYKTLPQTQIDKNRSINKKVFITD
jgi:hypothetical protein